MTEIDAAFLEGQIIPLEEYLLSLELAELFTGMIYTSPNQPLTALTLEGLGEETIELTPAEVGRLFMAPDESILRILRLEEQPDGTPAGVNVWSDNDFVQEGEPVLVVAYQDTDGPGVRLTSLHLARIMLDADAPARLCTIAFGLMVCTAFRRGFKQVTLFAGGNGPPPDDIQDGDLIGYMVWPKFGFDAQLLPADLNGEPRLRHCHSVLDVIRTDSDWWEQKGRGREMAFDLTSHSRSWDVLLNYLYTAIAEELP
jgi:hypothetical protein